MQEKPVAGIDVSKDFSEMCIIAPDNSVHSHTRIYHDLTSMKRALTKLEDASNQFSDTPVIVLESTAHYHRILAQFLQSAGYEVLIINPLQSSSLKNINIRKVKNDKIDAYRIALLYRLKTLHSTNQPCSVLSEIRDLCRQRSDLVHDHTSYTLRLSAILDQTFPKYSGVFSRITSKASLAILKNYPTPSDVLAAGPDLVAQSIAVYSRRRIDSPYVLKKIALLFDVASEAVLLNFSRESYSVLTKITIGIIEQLQQSIKLLETKIKQQARLDSNVWTDIQLLESIPGIGNYAATVIRAEIGNFSSFSKPKQLVAFFGLDPSVRQSGRFCGTKTKLSKRGSPYARGILDICVQTSIHTRLGGPPRNPVLSDYYNKKLESKAPKVAKCAVMRKMVDIIFAVLRDKRPFELRTPEQHIQQMQRSVHKKAA